MDIEIKSKKLNKDKLCAFGFEEINGYFYYSADILDGQMRMTVTLSQENLVHIDVIDSASGEEYVLHGVAGAAGAFVGRVKAEYEAVLEKIPDKCFLPDVFKTEQAKASFHISVIHTAVSRNICGKSFPTMPW